MVYAPAPPSKPGHKGATPSTFYAGERATPTSTHVASTPPEQLIATSHPGKSINSHPTRPQGKEKGNQNAPSHQPRKKVVNFSQQNNEKSAHHVWKRKEEGKNSATSEIRPPPHADSSNEEKKQSTTATRSPPKMNSANPSTNSSQRVTFTHLDQVNGGGKEREENRQRNIAGRGRE